jgi:hypothetical protein
MQNIMTTRMWQSRHQSLVMVAILLLALGTTAAGFWWLCTRNNGIAFLPARPGAEWIVYPKPPEAMEQFAVPIRAVFRYTFRLNAPPDRCHSDGSRIQERRHRHQRANPRPARTGRGKLEVTFDRRCDRIAPSRNQ